MDQQAAKRLIEDTFNQPFDQGRFRHLAINLLNNVDEGKAFNWTAGAYIKDSFKDHVKKYRRLGTYTDPDGQKIDILIVHLKKPWALDRSRTTQRNFVATYLKQRGEKDAALVAYHTDDPTNWRFSFVRMEYREELTPAGKVHVKEEFTPARRYSFLVGQNEPSHTVQEQLFPVLKDDGHPTIDAIEQAFSVEAVTKQFYLDYRELFESVTDALQKLIEADSRVRKEFEDKSIDPANFAKKLLGQIVFLYFLQKKGWLGVGKDDQGNLKPWGTGPKNFLQRLFNREFIDYDNFFNHILEPLFYEALATERPDDYYSRFNCKIPFLNGGLFEAIHDYNWREIDILLPNELFRQIFETFDLYNFTVREDEPLEKEVAVDPEMLGKVFENLLPENLRKGKGTYYTPRPIVHYMCQESLIYYLNNILNSPPFQGGVPAAGGGGGLNNLPQLKTLRKKLRNNLTPAEAALWNLLRNKQLNGRKFRRQHSVGNYILDFYCPSEKLAVELDGEVHNNSEQAEYDRERDLFLQHTGIKVLRFENSIVFKNPEGLLQRVREEFGWTYNQPPRPSGTPPYKGGEFVRVPKEDIEELVRRGESAVEHDLAKQEGTKTYKYKLPESIRAHAKLLDDKLAGIKVCDPAVGSGAFPVGMMHEIVKARTVLTTYLADKTERDTYALKRHCIQESLYGVDIDPGAIDIAKLRLWLSLIVDEEDYQRINPLPNLDYKIMQGNSLIEDFHGISLDLGKSDNGDLLGEDPELEQLIKDLHEKQNAFFNATHPGEKRRLKDAVEEAILAVFRYRLQQEKKPYYESLNSIERTASTLPEHLRAQYLREETEKLNKRFDFDPEAVEHELREMTHGNKVRDFFPWRLYFADVFRNKGGFDVVIANPPYVRQELISEQKPLLKEAFPDVYQGTADLYVYFYRRALDIAHSDGFVTFISSNKFFRAGYGKKLRTYLQENTKLETVIDFGDLPVFEATTYPCVLVISNHSPNPEEDTLRALNVRNIETIKHLPDAVAREGWLQPQRSLRREGWSLERPEVLALLEKLRHSGTPLGEYVNGKFYYGIKTGLNKAFVIDQATRDRLIAEDPRSAEIIKPWLRGQDVKRWRTDWAGLYLLWTYQGISIEKYPAVFEYLSQFREKLAKRWEPSRGQCEWYELRPCDYYAEFEKPKIVYPNICKRPEFAFDETNLYTNQKCFIIPTTDKYLLGVLNCSVTFFLYRQVLPKLRGDFYEPGHVFLKDFPIAVPTASQRAAIEALVCKLLDAKGQGPQVQEWEKELNRLVYKLYGLTAEEIRIIEEATKTGQELQGGGA
jgi:very-short-patch-repair endonuclease